MALTGKIKILEKIDNLLHKEELEIKYSLLNEIINYGQRLAKIGFWTYEVKTGQVFWTDEIYNLLGCGLNDLTEKLESFLYYVHSDDLEMVKEATQDVLKEKEYDIEYRIVTHNGQVMYVHEKTKVILDENNNSIKMVGMIQDITEHKLRENNLNAIGDNFNQAQRVAGVGSWKYDVIKDEFYGTDEMFSIYGVDRLKFNTGFSNTIKLIHPEDQFKLQEAMEKYLLGLSSNIEYRIPQSDGTMKYVIGNGEPIFDKEQRVIGVLGTLQDITKTKNLEQELKRNYKIINQAQTLAHIGSWEMDIVNYKNYWSDEAYKIHGITPEQYDNTYEGFKKNVHPDDVKKIDYILENPVREPIDLEYRIIRNDGSVRNIYQLVEFIFNKDGNPIYIYGNIQDITEKKELQKRIEFEQIENKKMQRKFNALIKESVDVFEILDSDGRIVYISEASEKVIGYKPEERIGKKIYEYYDESEIRKLTEMVEFVLSEPKKRTTKDIQFRTKAGRVIFLEVYMQNFLHDSAIEGIVVNFRDITSRVETERRITHLSTYDQLTGLPNNISLEKKLKLQLQYAKETKTSFAIFMLDIDSLRYIKDTLGYKAGEKYIIQIALKLKLYCGSTKFVCRYCDNRFVIIERIHTVDEYEVIVKEIYELFSQAIRVDKYELDVDLSIGISTYHEDEQDNEVLIRHAETAIFLAKNEGKNRYKFYSSDINIQSYKQFTIRNDLRKAIENNQLRIYYQPLVNLGTTEILAAEALIRWEHPEWGVISPIEFISMAEETGYIIKIGHWLLREVCRNYKQWLNNGLPKIKVSINFSSLQFFETNFVENIKNTINEYELDPHFLIMEITESILMEKADKVISDFKRLQSLGIQVALDDFGTGYSSLAYLSSFNIDILKIDGSFIMNINKDETSTTITRYIIKMAQDLKIKVVAEHIETWDQLSFLRELKCYMGQGYIFSKPVPLKDFEKVLANRKCKPLIVNDSIPHEDKRKFFRVKFTQTLEAGVTVLEIKGKKVNVGNTKVLIKNIGPGGLCFISNIRLPIERDIILQFTTQLIGEEIKTYGCPVWTEEVDNNLFEYGVEFTIDENKRTDLVKVLSQVQIKMRNDIMFADGSFISGSPYLYFRPQQLSDAEKNYQ